MVSANQNSPIQPSIFYNEDSALSPVSERCEELENLTTQEWNIHVDPISIQASVPSPPAESSADGSVCLWRTNKQVEFRHFHYQKPIKVHPRTGHEGPEGEQRYSSTLFLTSVLEGLGDQHHTPVILPLGKKPVTHCNQKLRNMATSEILSGLPQECAARGRKTGKRWQMKKRKMQQRISWNHKEIKSFQSHWCWEVILSNKERKFHLKTQLPWLWLGAWRNEDQFKCDMCWQWWHEETGSYICDYC